MINDIDTITPPHIRTKASWDKKYCIVHTGTGNYYSMNGMTTSLFSKHTKLFNNEEDALYELKLMKIMKRNRVFSLSTLSRLDVCYCYVEKIVVVD